MQLLHDGSVLHTTPQAGYGSAGATVLTARSHQDAPLFRSWLHLEPGSEIFIDQHFDSGDLVIFERWSSYEHELFRGPISANYTGFNLEAFE